MTLYYCLRDVPLPERLSGSLDERIISLVRGVHAQDIFTFGSCEGHMDHGKRYPWVSFDNSDDSRLLELLIDAYNRDRPIQWRVDGNSIRTKRSARNQNELIRLQTSADILAQFLFEYRPEALDPAYTRRVIRIPDFAQFDDELQRIYRRLENLSRRCEASPFDMKLKKEFNALLDNLDDLDAKAFASGDMVLDVTERQIRRYLRRAAELLHVELPPKMI